MKKLALLALVACHVHPAHPTAGTEYDHGRWFDGEKFVDKTMYVVDGVFAEAPPARVTDVVDLKDGYVVPPYAEGHNHWLEANLVDAYVQTYLRDGIFYVRDMCTAPSIHDAMRPALGGPASVDYVSAHQGFTGPGGHPIELVEGLASIGVLPAAWATTRGEGDALFQVSSEADLDRDWPTLLAGHPDFVKVFLVHSDEYAARRDDADLSPKQRGLDPALVPAIVARAHRDHLRVAAHIEDAHDFHVAVDAGVDDVAHMPFVEADDPEAYRLDDADLRALAARHGTITTTLDWMDDDSVTDATIAMVRTNLAAMRAAGVTVTIGTDLFRQDARVEADRIVAHHLMTNLELLVAWSVDTPHMIFPDRRLGRLADGFEASFLVLAGDPLADWTHAEEITMRVKQGHLLVPGDAQIPPFPGG